MNFAISDFLHSADRSIFHEVQKVVQRLPPTPISAFRDLPKIIEARLLSYFPVVKFLESRFREVKLFLSE
jgi:hypothetical protein